MTTFAYRKGILVADTCVTSQGIRVGSTVKITKRGRLLAAAAGNASICRTFCDWVQGGLKGEGPQMLIPDGKDGFCAWGYLFMPDGLCLSFEPSGVNHMRAEFITEGSGSLIAFGAMAYGASAEEAVLIACQYDGASQTPITILTHE